MLGSYFPWAPISAHEEHQEEDCHRPTHQHSPRQLLVQCGELISSDDLSSAHCILSYLRNSPYGDSNDRLCYLFTKALSFCLARKHKLHHTTPDFDIHQDILNSAYLSLNQVTPFIRFSHLTANQAILEALSGHQSIHIIDFNILQGVQWPPFMQALSALNHRNPPTLRLTAIGPDIAFLQRTGSRLKKFAHSIGLTFQFHQVQSISSVNLFPEEGVAVNAVHYFHRLLGLNRGLVMLIEKIKGMNPRPKVVTIGEREASYNEITHLGGRVEALWDHYAAIFSSMEATLPPQSKERMAVEQGWFGREIMSLLDGGMKHERFEVWEEMMRETGLENVGLSGFSVSQAKLLLRLHYPSEGYRLQIVDQGKCLLLGWQNHALFSVSSWRFAH